MLAVDLIGRNDVLRALDVLLQREQTMALEVQTGNWRKGQALEFVAAGELSSCSREELKVAQEETKTNYRFAKGAGKMWSRSHASH